MCNNRRRVSFDSQTLGISTEIFTDFFSRSTKYIVMIPCNSDDEVEDSWIHTSHHQLKHKPSGLCIGKHQLFSDLQPWVNISIPFSDRKNLDKNFVHAAVCDPNSKTQKWEFQKNERNWTKTLELVLLLTQFDDLDILGSESRRLNRRQANFACFYVITVCRL